MDDTKNVTILLVEDDAFIAMAEKRMLEKYHYTVMIAHSGERAVEMVDTAPDCALILMDINLGAGIDGTEAATQILNRRDIPIIFLSSHTEREVVEKTEGITSYGYIVKNSGETVLMMSIKMALRLFDAKMETKTYADKLLKSEHDLRTLLNDSPVIIAHIDRDLRYTLIHNPHPDFVPDAVLGKRDDEIAINEGTRRLMALKQRVIESGCSACDEITFPVSNGDQTYEVRATPRKDECGLVIGAATAAINITEYAQTKEKLLQQLEEKEVLLKEAHHRIKNNIASIESLFSIHANMTTAPEVISALQDASSRVRSMRVLYEKLLVSSDYHELSSHAYLNELIAAIVATFPDSLHITFTKHIDDVALDSKRLFCVGMIINELLSNALKYAFPVRKEDASLHLAFVKDDRHITLTVQDNGQGLPEGFDLNTSKGFGLLIVDILSQQLLGHFTIGNDHGTKSILEFTM